MLTAALLDDVVELLPLSACDLWTPHDVELWLVAAFGALPGSAVQAQDGGLRAAAGSQINPAHFDWIAFSATVLGRASRERLAVLTWARLEAGRRSGFRGGGSVSQFCGEMGWTRHVFMARRDAALARLARARSRMGWE
jgi:hypothetical protein